MIKSSFSTTKAIEALSGLKSFTFIVRFPPIIKTVLGRLVNFTASSALFMDISGRIIMLLSDEIVWRLASVAIAYAFRDLVYEINWRVVMDVGESGISSVFQLFNETFSCAAPRSDPERRDTTPAAGPWINCELASSSPLKPVAFTGIRFSRISERKKDVFFNWNQLSGNGVGVGDGDGVGEFTVVGVGVFVGPAGVAVGIFSQQVLSYESQIPSGH